MIKSYPKDKDKPKPDSFIPVSEYRVNFLSKSGKKNKYGACKIDFNGHRYDSKLEARVAEDLEFQRLSGLLIEVKQQVKIPLVVKGVLICTYYCDFRTVDKYGQVTYIEAKGLELPVWQIKKKLFLALLSEIDPGANFEMIKP